MYLSPPTIFFVEILSTSKRLFNPGISRISVYYEIVVDREFHLGAKYISFYYCTVILIY